MKTKRDLIEVLERNLSEMADAMMSEIQDGFDEGYEKGKEAGEEYAADNFEATEPEEVNDTLAERIGCEFAVEKFKDCKTLEDFQTEYAWIYSRSLNFMK